MNGKTILFIKLIWMVQKVGFASKLLFEVRFTQYHSLVNLQGNFHLSLTVNLNIFSQVILFFYEGRPQLFLNLKEVCECLNENKKPE